GERGKRLSGARLFVLLAGGPARENLAAAGGVTGSRGLERTFDTDPAHMRKERVSLDPARFKRGPQERVVQVVVVRCEVSREKGLVDLVQTLPHATPSTRQGESHGDAHHILSPN